jgi:hypothetical protein
MSSIREALEGMINKMTKKIINKIEELQKQKDENNSESENKPKSKKKVKDKSKKKSEKKEIKKVTRKKNSVLDYYDDMNRILPDRMNYIIKNCESSKELLLMVLKEAYFNKNNRKTLSVYLTNLETKKIKAYEDGKWIIEFRSSVVSDILCVGRTIIERYYKDHGWQHGQLTNEKLEKVKLLYGSGKFKQMVKEMLVAQSKKCKDLYMFDEGKQE